MSRKSRFHANAGDEHLRSGGTVASPQRHGRPELNRFAEEARQKLCTYMRTISRSMSCCAWRRRADAAGIVSRMDEAIRNREGRTGRAKSGYGPGHLRPYVGVHGGARGGMKHDVTTTINWPEWPAYGCNSCRPAAHGRGNFSDLSKSHAIALDCMVVAA